MEKKFRLTNTQKVKSLKVIIVVKGTFNISFVTNAFM